MKLLLYRFDQSLSAARKMKFSPENWLKYSITQSDEQWKGKETNHFFFWFLSVSNPINIYISTQTHTCQMVSKTNNPCQTTERVEYFIFIANNNRFVFFFFWIESNARIIYLSMVRIANKNRFVFVWHDQIDVIFCRPIHFCHRTKNVLITIEFDKMREKCITRGITDSGHSSFIINEKFHMNFIPLYGKRLLIDEIWTDTTRPIQNIFHIDQFE